MHDHETQLLFSKIPLYSFFLVFFDRPLIQFRSPGSLQLPDHYITSIKVAVDLRPKYAIEYVQESLKTLCRTLLIIAKNNCHRARRMTETCKHKHPSTIG